MKKSTRMLLGISIALITAASLNFTIGNRFHHRQWGSGWSREGGPHYGHRDCGDSHSYRGDDRMKENSSREPSRAVSP
ncbi:hypothetical protein LZG74_05900 [Dyadobacter sp. CY327]|uniref:hypothetical protein n=1 Tax=Dyadobacter sp. CY327 TaxID=2907301 RepID=UPI001F1D2668|nr:hypothetical protein [Dyadobacter sp. CY327]MCE7069824.1 hypothetical protein [Dyadobacter sp. CY327]